MFYSSKLHYNNDYYPIINTNDYSGAFYTENINLPNGSVGIDYSGNTTHIGTFFNASKSWTGESKIVNILSFLLTFLCKHLLNAL